MAENKVELFPIEVRGIVDQMLLDNKTIVSIVEYLKQEHNIKIKNETLSKYKTMLFKHIQQENKAALVAEEIPQEEVKKIQLVANKKDLLESLIAENYQRLQDIRRMNKRRYDPKWESFITSYTENIRKIVETLSKFNEELDSNTEQIDNIVKRHLTKLLRCVYETVKAVCPDKSIQFKQVLTEKYKELQ